MARHEYDNPTPLETHTHTSLGGVMAIPAATHVELRDGNDQLTLVFTDIDRLDDTIRLLTEARAKHVEAIADGRSEIVDVEKLTKDDLVVIEGDLAVVQHIVIQTAGVIVRFSRKYDGMWDDVTRLMIEYPRRQQVRRLLDDVSLAVV